MTVAQYTVPSDMLCIECEDNVSQGSILKCLNGAWLCSNCEEYESLGE